MASSPHAASDVLARDDTLRYLSVMAEDGWRQCGPSLSRSNSRLGAVASTKSLCCSVLARLGTRDNGLMSSRARARYDNIATGGRCVLAPPVEKRGGGVDWAW